MDLALLTIPRAVGPHSAHETGPTRLTEEEWEAQKQRIGGLYRVMTLPCLMLVMQFQHHFFASKKQYKTKLKLWGFDVKNRRPPTRKPRKQSADKEQEAPAPETASGNYTYQKTATRSDANIRPCTCKCTKFSVSSENTERAVSRMESPQRMLSPDEPHELDVLEIAYFNTACYINACIDPNIWTDVSPSFKARREKYETARNALLQLEEAYTEADNLLKKGFFEDAQATIANGETSAVAMDLLSSDFPGNLGSIFDMIYYFAKTKSFRICVALMKSFSTLGNRDPSNRHPLPQVFDHLSKLPPSYLCYGIVVALNVVQDGLESVLGSNNRHSLGCQLHYLRRIERYRDPYQELQGLQSLLEICQRSFSESDKLTLSVSLTLARAHVRNHDFQAAEALAQDIICRTKHKTTEVVAHDSYVAGLFILGGCQGILGSPTSGDAKMQTALEVLRNEGYGDTHYLVNKINAWLSRSANPSSGLLHDTAEQVRLLSTN